MLSKFAFQIKFDFQFFNFRSLAFRAIACTILAVQLSLANCPDVNAQQDSIQWGQWRGPLGTGESPTAKPPTRWSETENVRWKTKLPALGHSTPVVWDNLVFLTAAAPIGEKFEPIPDSAPGSHDNLNVDSKHKFVVLAIDRETGKILWETKVHEAIPHEGSHISGSLASASPSTDGRYVYASFGTYGIYCLDFDGNVVWKKMLGTMNSKHGHGEGASPYVYKNSVIVNWDHEGKSFIVALDKTNGNENWRADRTEVTSWASPIVYQHTENGITQDQVIVAGTAAVRAYDLKTGDVIWQFTGLSANVVATPIAADGMVYLGSSYEKKAMFAIRLAGAKGDITNDSNVVWKRVERTPYVPSPLLYRDSLYFLAHYQNVLSVIEAKTGTETNGPFRMSGVRNIYASPVAADGKIFITDLDGMTVVVSEPDLPRLLSANQLDDQFSASIALVGDELFLRGAKFLYCIGEK